MGVLIKISIKTQARLILGQSGQVMVTVAKNTNSIV